MNKWKVFQKVVKGCIIGAVGAAAAIRPDDIEGGAQVVTAAIVIGLINGGFNAWKHRNA